MTEEKDTTVEPKVDSPDLEGDEFVKASLVHDPFAGKNPVQLKAHPHGLRLYWVNPEFRDRYGWRGWNPVKYDSPIGRNLHKYLNEAPTKLANQVDDFVRRGDSLLCWIEEGIFQARQNRRSERALAKVGGSANKEQTEYADGKASTFGHGLEWDNEVKRKARKGMAPKPKTTRDLLQRTGRNLVEGTAAGGDSTE